MVSPQPVDVGGDVGRVGLLGGEQRFDAERADGRGGRGVGGLFAQLARPAGALLRPRRRPAGGGDQLPDGAVGRVGEVVGTDVAGRVADRPGMLEQELQGLALDREPWLPEIGQLLPRRRLGAGGLTGRRGGPRRAVSRSANLVARLLDVDADHPGQLARERVDLGLVADARHQPGALPNGVDPAVGPVEVVLPDHVGEHEPVERHRPRPRARAPRHHPP